MPFLLVVFIWLIVTLIVTSGAILIGKRYGVEYPIAIMASLIVIANIMANKIVVLGSFTVPGSVIIFSMSFLITDLLSEGWGKKYARKAVWAGFYANIALVLSLYIVVTWPAAPFSLDLGEKFHEILALTPRIVVASMIAYLISQHHDVWAFHKIKDWTSGRHLWLRNNAATIVSQLFDSVIFITIAFYGLFPIWPLILGQWIIKSAIALIDTPFLYGNLWLMDKIPTIKGER